ncbi:hypothetical protein [uncultured Cetobacterium sp.]|uniref:hypothetical protein n=2 Tax=uncultured Cetobacterium sp. TaxID=527638 RepID=UPI00263565E8|nr:hypothetical protein [uncultured Cetobacterium sp.]
MKNKILLLHTFLYVTSLTFSIDNIEQPLKQNDTSVYITENKQVIFKEISVGQNIEIDNTAGGKNIGEEVIFLNEVILKTENWKYSLIGGVVFSSDTDDLFEDSHARMQIEAIRNFKYGFSGVRWRAQNDYNKYYFRTGYDYNIFSGWADLQYIAFNSNNPEQDCYELEIMPANIALGPVTVGYYLDYIKYTGRGTKEDSGLLQESFSHQLRTYFPIYSNNKLELNMEYRLGLHDTENYSETTNTGFRISKNFGYHSFILNADYSFTESVDLSAYYKYDISDFEDRGNPATPESGKYYGEFYLGWTYTF